MTDLTPATHQPIKIVAPEETVALAAEIATYARAAGDAIAMLEAARALLTVPREVFRPGAPTPAMLFAEARILAGGDAGLLAEIDWVQHGRERAIQVAQGSYAAKNWVVRHGGDGTALKPVVTQMPKLHNRAAVWGGTVSLKA
jgi:hypothetical protein